MTLGPIRQWRIHLGAHKTATTHFQETLAALRPSLAAMGVDVVPLEPFRGIAEAGALAPGCANWRLAFRGWPLRARLSRALAPLRCGPGVLAISEENLPGVSRDLLVSPLYPQAETRLSGLAGLGADLRLFLGIRSFDEVLPSAYAQALRATEFPGRFAEVAAHVAAAMPSWADLAERLRRIAPRASLTVWTMEAYRADPRAVMAAFLGIDPGLAPDLPPPTRTVTPPAAAIAEAEALPLGLPKPERRARTAEIYARHLEAGGPKFAPLSPDLRAALRTGYRADLSRLRRMSGVELLHV